MWLIFLRWTRRLICNWRCRWMSGGCQLAPKSITLLWRPISYLSQVEAFDPFHVMFFCAN